VEQSSRATWFRLALVFLGLFGAAFAITGFLVALPKPAVGGTCGPGKSSEAAIVALFNPGSIGAGPEPPASSATDRADWMAFVGECQASADGRVLGALVILGVSLVVALVGTALFVKSRKRPVSAAADVAPSPYAEYAPPGSPLVSR
jgi:hypothetical protein